MFEFLLDPAMIAVLGTALGGILMKLLESQFRPKPIAAVAVEEPIDPIYACSEYDQRLWESKLEEAGILETKDMSICDKPFCRNCKPTRVARHPALNPYFDNNEFRRINRAIAKYEGMTNFRTGVINAGNWCDSTSEKDRC